MNPRAGFDRLPYDVVYSIFLILQDKDLPNFPTIASHVSQRWRYFALESPVLWNDIRISSQWHWDKYEAYVARSRDLYLHITFNKGAFYRPAITHLKRVMRLLLPHASRWLSLTICDASFKIVRVLFDALHDNPLPALTHLTITGTPPLGCWKGPSAHALPNLRHLHLSPVVFNYSSLVFNDLTSLYIRDRQYGTLGTTRWQPDHPSGAELLLNLLGRSPLLRELQVEANDNPEAGSVIPVATRAKRPVTSHSFLSRLSLPRYLIQHFFPSVDLPALRSLADKNSPQFNPLYLKLLPIIAGRPTSYPLTSITLTLWGFTGIPHQRPFIVHLPAVLARLPLLETLGLNVIEFQLGRWAAAFTPSCLPCLTTLEVERCRGVNAEDVLQFVRSRMAPGSGVVPLNRLKFHSHPEDSRGYGSSEWVAALEELHSLLELTTMSVNSQCEDCITTSDEPTMEISL